MYISTECVKCFLLLVDILNVSILSCSAIPKDTSFDFPEHSVPAFFNIQLSIVILKSVLEQNFFLIFLTKMKHVIFLNVLNSTIYQPLQSRNR